MRVTSPVNLRQLASLLLLASLTACNPAPKAEDTAARMPSPPANGTSATAGVRPTSAGAAPAAAAVPTVVAQEPALEAMRLARPVAKVGVPVDLKYTFDAEPLPDQTVTLHLAAIPRVAGTNLAVSIKAVDGIRMAKAGSISAQKASADTAYRQQISVTRTATGPTELRVLITMEMSEGSAFGFFSIPFEPGMQTQKMQDSVKQR